MAAWMMAGSMWTLALTMILCFVVAHLHECICNLGMCAGYSGALATTNSQTAVLVLTLLTPAAVNTSDVSLALQGGAPGTVNDVQAFPDQASSYLIEVPPGSHNASCSSVDVQVY